MCRVPAARADMVLAQPCRRPVQRRCVGIMRALTAWPCVRCPLCGQTRSQRDLVHLGDGCAEAVVGMLAAPPCPPRLARQHPPGAFVFNGVVLAWLRWGFVVAIWLDGLGPSGTRCPARQRAILPNEPKSNYYISDSIVESFKSICGIEAVENEPKANPNKPKARSRRTTSARASQGVENPLACSEREEISPTNSCSESLNRINGKTRRGDTAGSGQEVARAAGLEHRIGSVNFV